MEEVCMIRYKIKFKIINGEGNIIWQDEDEKVIDVTLIEDDGDK